MQSVGRVTASLLFSWLVRRLLSLARHYHQQMQHKKIMLRHVSTLKTNSCQVYNTIFHPRKRSTNNTILPSRTKMRHNMVQSHLDVIKSNHLKHHL